MQLLNSYSQPPGHCRLCTSAVTPVIDTQRDYDSDGLGGCLYVCFNCASNMAQLLGWCSPERLADLEDELERTCERLDTQETENADLAAQLETVREAITIVTPATPKRGPGRPRKTDA